MLWVPPAVMVVAFAAGLLVAQRYAPALAPTQTGRISARVVEILVGAAAAVLALNVYTLVRNIDSADVSLDAEVFAFIATDALWQTGLLVAAAAAVHLLAPPPDEA